MVYIKDFTHRLGNQLFQLAAAIGLAVENNDTVRFPNWNYSKYFSGDFTNPAGQIYSPGRIFQQNGHHFEKIPYEKDIVLSGYFQSEKYFEHCKDLIKEMFTPVSYKDADGGPPTCSIHIRLGDYLSLPNHHPVPTWENYYEKAIREHIQLRGNNNFRYRVYSDDIGHASRLLDTKDFQIEFVDEPDTIKALCSMMACDDNIIGNSSFSWWAAYLNKNTAKVVISPNHKNWFGSAYSHLKTHDTIPDSWIQI